MLARLSQRLLPHLNSTLRARTSLARVCGVKPSRAFHSMDTSGLNSRVCAVLGAQWGDEGKGKLVDVLVHHYDICGRFNGGANAGHTLVVDGRKFAFHVLPCGLVTPGKKNVIGNGVVLHVPSMLEELAQLDEAGIEYRSRLFISDRAHLLFDVHRAIDARQEAVLDGKSIGTTKKGIGPCYASKALRHGVRVGELRKWTSFEARFRTMIGDLSAMYGEDVLACDVDAELERYREYAELIGPMITDTVHLVNSAYRNNESILAEGANAALLDLDYGTYPFVTSSATTGGGISTGLGVAPTLIDTTIGVVKAYTTRVGSGPFPTELEDEVGAALRDNGHEYGTTTGRPRRCGWLDLPVVNYSHMVNNYQSLNITKLDVLDTLDEVKIGTHYRLRGERLPFGMMPAHLEDLAEVEVEYESMPGWKTDLTKVRRFKDLPPNAQAYINRIEELTGISVSWIGVGPEREAMVTKGFDVKV